MKPMRYFNSGSLLFYTLLASFVICDSVQAAPIKLYFEGFIQTGSFAYDPGSSIPQNWDGLHFTGELGFDPQNTVVGTDDLTYQLNTSSAPVMTMSLNLPNGALVSADNMSSPQFLMELYRNYTNPADTNLLLLTLHNNDYLPNGGAWKSSFLFEWETGDHLGASSSLFSDPNGGISYTQPINLDGYAFSTLSNAANHGQWGNFRVAGSDYLYSGDFALTSIQTSPIASVPEPESYAMFLAGLGIMGFVARRRKDNKS
jgi:hypothetical protein